MMASISNEQSKTFQSVKLPKVTSLIPKWKRLTVTLFYFQTITYSTKGYFVVGFILIFRVVLFLAVIKISIMPEFFFIFMTFFVFRW